MLVGAFYRQPDKTDADYLNKVKEEISTIKEKIPQRHLCTWRRFQPTRYQLGRTNNRQQTISNKTNQTYLGLGTAVTSCIQAQMQTTPINRKQRP